MKGLGRNDNRREIPSWMGNNYAVVCFIQHFTILLGGIPHCIVV